MASKLLVRKLPHLPLLYDRLVRQLLGRPDNHWACVWTWFRSDPARLKALRALQAEVPSLASVSLVRRLDVVVWMQANTTGKPT